MVVVRYAALAALVIWLAGMLTMAFGDVVRRPEAQAACGAVVLLSLFVIKFVGPPPRGFKLRAPIVALMLLVVALAMAGFVPADAAIAANLALGAILLFWYVYE